MEKVTKKFFVILEIVVRCSVSSEQSARFCYEGLNKWRSNWWFCVGCALVYFLLPPLIHSPRNPDSTQTYTAHLPTVYRHGKDCDVGSRNGALAALADVRKQFRPEVATDCTFPTPAWNFSPPPHIAAQLENCVFYFGMQRIFFSLSLGLIYSSILYSWSKTHSCCAEIIVMCRNAVLHFLLRIFRFDTVLCGLVWWWKEIA